MKQSILSMAVVALTFAAWQGPASAQVAVAGDKESSISKAKEDNSKGRCLTLAQYSKRVSAAIGGGRWGCVKSSQVLGNWGGTTSPCNDVVTKLKVVVWGGDDPNQTITLPVYTSELKAIGYNTEKHLLGTVGLPACWND